MLLVVCGVFLLAVGSTDCDPFLLDPSKIWVSSIYDSRFPVDNLLDGRWDTMWASKADTNWGKVFIDYPNYVDIKYVWIMEGNHYAIDIYVLNRRAGGKQIAHANKDDDTRNYKFYNFWFEEFITDQITIEFEGGEINRVHVSEVEVWGCNYASTEPTAIPTLPTNSPTIIPTASPSQMPTNLARTVAPTSVPTVSPSQMPTNLTIVAPTSVPTLSPSQMPTNSTLTVLPTMSPTDIPTDSLTLSILPTMSPSQMPTNSISTVLPTMSPTDMPTTMPSMSPTQFPTGTFASKDNCIIANRVDDLLVVAASVGVVIVIFLGFKLRKRKITQQNAEHKMQLSLCSAAGRAEQTDNAFYNAEGTQMTTTLKIAGENGRPEGDQVYSIGLDKVSSGDKMSDTRGALEIGSQDSAL